MLAKQALDQLSHLPSLSHFLLSAFFMVVVVMVCVCVCVVIVLVCSSPYSTKKLSFRRHKDILEKVGY